MLANIRAYFDLLFERLGDAWNRFWFTPVDPLPLSVMRVLTGMVATYSLLSFTPDLERFFSPNGMMPNGIVSSIEGMRDADYGGAYRFTFFDPLRSERGLAPSASTVQMIHWASVAVVALYTLGLFSRVTSVLAAVTMLSYAHRMYIVVSPFELVLNFLMIYACLGPSGAYMSLDHWLRNRQPGAEKPTPSTGANIALRLMQVHLAAVFVMMVLAKLFGDAWWNGTAFWWMTQNSRGGLIDLTGLATLANEDSPPLGRYLINAWGHAQVAYELLFPVLIWNRTARPLLLGVGVLLWTLLALASGLFTFGLVMIIATTAFISADGWRTLFGERQLEFAKAKA